jgi:hypothetical protein
LAVRFDCFEFAFDRERARDFSEDGLNSDPATGLHVIEHMVSAGLRLSFIQHLPSDPLDEPEYVTLVQSILSNIPQNSLHRDGSMRSLLERRIAISRHRHECRANFPMNLFDRDDSTSTALKLGGEYFSDQGRAE